MTPWRYTWWQRTRPEEQIRHLGCGLHLRRCPGSGGVHIRSGGGQGWTRLVFRRRVRWAKDWRLSLQNMPELGTRGVLRAGGRVEDFGGRGRRWRRPAGGQCERAAKVDRDRPASTARRCEAGRHDRIDQNEIGPNYSCSCSSPHTTASPPPSIPRPQATAAAPVPALTVSVVLLVSLRSSSASAGQIL